MDESRWTYTKATTSKVLKAWECHFGGFSESSPRSVDRLEVPVASTVVILCCGEPISLQPALRLGSPSRLAAFSAGLQVRAQRVMHTGMNDCVEIRMSPLAAYALFGGAMAESASDPVNLFDLGYHPIAALLGQLQTKTAWSDRLRAVDQFLQRGFCESQHRIPTRLMWAWNAFERSHGQVRVHQVARHIGCSERYLTKQFHAYFGIGPKAVARRLRFSRAFDLLTSRSSDDLSTIGAEAGFSDQSHMTREFREFSGLTPNTVRTARFPDLPGIPASALSSE